MLLVYSLTTGWGCSCLIPLVVCVFCLPMMSWFHLDLAVLCSVGLDGFLNCSCFFFSGAKVIWLVCLCFAGAAHGFCLSVFLSWLPWVVRKRFVLVVVCVCAWLVCSKVACAQFCFFTSNWFLLELFLFNFSSG